MLDSYQLCIGWRFFYLKLGFSFSVHVYHIFENVAKNINYLERSLLTVFSHLLRKKKPHIDLFSESSLFSEEPGSSL